MRRPWLQLAITSIIAISLIAAPCKNCQPKTQADAKHASHDCCPKPKPQKSQTCSWQPAAFDAVESKSDLTIDAPAVLPILAAIALPSAGSWQPRIIPTTTPPGLRAPTILRV